MMKTLAPFAQHLERIKQILDDYHDVGVVKAFDEVLCATGGELLLQNPVVQELGELQMPPFVAGEPQKFFSDVMREVSAWLATVP